MPDPNYVSKILAELETMISSMKGQKARGSFNIFTGEIGGNPKDLVHEQGHQRDSYGAKYPWWIPGYTSGQDEFLSTVEKYKENYDLDNVWKVRFDLYPGIGDNPLNPEHNPMNLPFWTGGWGGPRELYADMWKWAEGDVSNLPSEFQSFYENATRP